MHIVAVQPPLVVFVLPERCIDNCVPFLHFSRSPIPANYITFATLAFACITSVFVFGKCTNTLKHNKHTHKHETYTRFTIDTRKSMCMYSKYDTVIRSSHNQTKPSDGRDGTIKKPAAQFSFSFYDDDTQPQQQ